MLVSEFDYELPGELIAQAPLEDRAGGQMLTLDRSTGAYRDRMFRDFPELLREGDVLVLNDSRVIPARLFARREKSHGRTEKELREAPTGRVQVFLTEQKSEWEWNALVRPGRKVLTGEVLQFGEQDDKPGLRAEVTAHGEFGERTLRFEPVEDFFGVVEALGHVPLPPYIHREDADTDRERYQTVYARERGSVAAPTAGLHFTPEILEQIQARGVRIAYVTLHVGLGTFQPVRVERVEDVHLHTERYTLPEATAAELNAARREGRRIVAAGTTTVRTLEHCALDGEFRAHSGSTQIFIAPGFVFKVVGALLTNFHLPQSTLLMLVSAFGGREHVLSAYKHAVAERYRFFSYGDCMFLS
ncbi:MAG TPA: tRNA preQ1(34) S-adenosylmethionine ribosyltransferase-isomerase QueA [Acidobacteriaceae bacterium]|nr:tRNA preQ1(34) S-adenosylmethionine ribosyltransferase-isomerase QueA [Acidobacteriaceae bacterium]